MRHESSLNSRLSTLNADIKGQNAECPRGQGPAGSACEQEREVAGELGTQPDRRHEFSLREQPLGRGLARQAIIATDEPVDQLIDVQQAQRGLGGRAIVGRIHCDAGASPPQRGEKRNQVGGGSHQVWQGALRAAWINSSS